MSGCSSKAVIYEDQVIVYAMPLKTEVSHMWSVVVVEEVKRLLFRNGGQVVSRLKVAEEGWNLFWI